MNEPHQACSTDPYAVPGPDDPPREWEREEAAYARVRERLVRDHLGQFVVIYQDDVLGPFGTFDEAIQTGYGRLGDVPLIVKQIESEEPPGFVSLVDFNHPSIRWVDR